MILQNKTLIGASILAFFVCSSKNLIIYNEEILLSKILKYSKNKKYTPKIHNTIVGKFIDNTIK